VHYNLPDSFWRTPRELSSSRSELTRPIRILRKPRVETTNPSFYLDASIRANGVNLSAKVDSTAVGLIETEAILRGIETLLCELVFSDFPIRDIPDMCPGIGRPVGEPTDIVDGSLVSVKRCREILQSSPGVRASSVHLSASERPILTARLYTDHPGIGISEFHRALVARLGPHSLAMAPHIYRIYAEPPARQGVPRWDDGKLLAVGTGRIVD
jgi:hypothetical protein